MTRILPKQNIDILLAKEENLLGMLKQDQKRDSLQCGMQMQQERLETTDLASE